MDFMERVERQLDLPQAEKAKVMRELRSHYEDLKEELVTSGMTQSQAESEAVRRLGEPADIAGQLSAVHNTASWKSTVLTVLPFAAAFVLGLIARLWTHESNATVAILFTIAVVFTAGAVREFVRGMRPVWLATWLVGSIWAVTMTGLFLLRGQWQLGGSSQHYAMVGTMAIRATILAVTALLVCWKAPKWRVAAMVAAVVSLLPLLYLASVPFTSESREFYRYYAQAATPLWIIDSIAIPLLIAFRVFATNSYGSASQASLFVFASYAISLFSGSVVRVRLVYEMLLIGAVAAATALIIAFVRASNWRNKVIILMSTVLLMQTLSMAAQYSATRASQGWQYIVLERAVYGGLTSLIWYIAILPPMLWDRLRKRRQAQIVR